MRRLFTRGLGMSFSEGAVYAHLSMDRLVGVDSCPHLQFSKACHNLATRAHGVEQRRERNHPETV